MRIHLRGDSANGVHTWFSVFVNGALAGQLVMRDEEASTFYQIVQHGCADGLDTFEGTGRWGIDEGDSPESEIEHARRRIG